MDAARPLVRVLIAPIRRIQPEAIYVLICTGARCYRRIIMAS
jgi:hypothetical protein